MFKKQFNRARLVVSIRPEGPVLVRSGEASLHPARPDLECVRTRHPEAGETVYLPGSSLKGVVRAQAERILMTLEVRVCDVLDVGDKGCHEKEIPYAGLCWACRAFGSTRWAGRVSLADAYPWEPDASRDAILAGTAAANETERRTGVAIDRRTGATAKGVLYELEVVTLGEFFATIALRNFQLWQVGLVGYVLRDLDQGHVRVGSGKSRGLGRVRAEVRELVLECSAARGPERIRGAGEFEQDPAYGLAPGDAIDAPASFERSSDGVFHRWRASDPGAAGELFRACQETPWQRFLEYASKSKAVS